MSRPKSLGKDLVGQAPNFSGPLRRVNEHVVSQGELLVGPPRWIASTTNTDCLEYTASTELAKNHGTLELPRLLGLVGLDASDIVHISAIDCAHQFDKRGLENASQSRLPVDGHSDFPTTSMIFPTTSPRACPRPRHTPLPQQAAAGPRRRRPTRCA